MNTNLLWASLVGGIAAFLLGWAIFGMLMTNYMETSMVPYEGLMKDEGSMNMGLLFLSNVVFAGVLSYAGTRMGVSDLKGGLLAGAVIGFLFYLSVDLSFLAMMNFFATPMAAMVDVVANTVWAAGTGAAVGFMLGRGKTRASA